MKSGIRNATVMADRPLRIGTLLAALLLIFTLPFQSLAGAADTGFMVVARDRGFLGNREIDAVMTRFKDAYPAALALIGDNRQGFKPDYTEYIRQAVKELEGQGIGKIVAIPLFLSAADATLARWKKAVTEAAGSVPVQWAPPMSDSYLTGQILIDRVEAISSEPAREQLIVTANGAVDEASERRIRGEIENLLHDVTDRHHFAEVSVHVYYDRDAQDREEKNRAVDEQIIRTAARRGRTLLVPLSIGVKYDQHMSEESWLNRKFGEFDITLGKSLLPHPEVLTWLKQTANRYSTASKREIGVVIMPHGSTRPYNEGLEAVIAPLRKRYRIEVAPGMGDPLILSQAVRNLEREGIRRIIFIRMYALRESMKARTDYILGLSRHLPDRHGPLPARIRSSAMFYPFGGYEEDPLIAEILRERIMEISEQPDRETVILLAHGHGDDERDRRWQDVINDNIQRIRHTLPRQFRAIKGMTVREDWPDKREHALALIRKEIEKGNRNGGRVLIISNRLYGSGPYERLLEGAEFEMNGQGLVPHPNITRWLEKGIEHTIRTASLPRAGNEGLPKGSSPNRVGR